MMMRNHADKIYIRRTKGVREKLILVTVILKHVQQFYHQLFEKENTDQSSVDCFFKMLFH